MSELLWAVVLVWVYSCLAPSASGIPTRMNCLLKTNEWITSLSLSLSLVWVICMTAGLTTAEDTAICTSKVWSSTCLRSSTGLSCSLPNRYENLQFFFSWTIRLHGGWQCSDRNSMFVIQKQILKEEYGPKLSDVEKQIAAHNILHKEIQAYRSQVDSKVTSETSDTHTHTHGSRIQL